MEERAWWAELPRDRFGDTPELNDELAALVIAGRKTATCCALAYYNPEVTKPGLKWVVETAAGEPACVLETTDVEFKRFDEIDEDWASAEGEGDLTLGWWREAHRTFFEREGSYAPDMPLACERFRLIEVIAP